MSITPYNVQTFRDGKWVSVISSELVPGDLVSIRKPIILSLRKPG